MATDTERLLSPEEVAERCSLSKRAVYRAIERGELPASRLCSRLRIRQDHLDAWIEGSRIAPQDPRRSMLQTELRGAPTSNGLRRLLPSASAGARP